MTSRDALSIGTDVKPPVLFKGEYEQWKDRFLDFIDRQKNGKNILTSIKEGPMPTVFEDISNEGNDSDGAPKSNRIEKGYAKLSDEQKNWFEADKTARSLLLQIVSSKSSVC
ncbi:hypothetical protein L6452_38684 [Arctium lappa]|uniref:Uncharacterized protein n=1 Tax=Arctium lappa TaxID=4217 RepID=A0ACB8XRD3_ARCLA|nr:hypothetical protein L6452_38684 [Arctium lappa]